MVLQLCNSRVIEPAPADVDPAMAAYAAALQEYGSNEAVPVEQRPPRQTLKISELLPADLAQLDACVKVVGGEEEAVAMFAAPIEWWDVVSDQGEPQYQLWLYHADCGLLFPAGTTRYVGSFIQTYFEGSEDFHDHAALAEAKAKAEPLYPDTSLRSYKISGV